MSTDAYSPVTGRWGVEGIWDVWYGSLLVALLGVLVIALAKVRWHKFLGAVAILLVVPAYFAVDWLGSVQVTHNGESIDCLLSGSTDYSSRCGSEYLQRYVLTATPVAVALVGCLILLIVATSSRIRRTPTADT